MANSERRIENANLRKKYGNKFVNTAEQRSTGTVEKLDYLKLLKEASPNTPESPCNRAKLFVVGDKGSGREALLRSLFNVEVADDTAKQTTQQIILGKYESESFQPVKIFNAKKIIMEVWNYSWKQAYTYLQDVFMTICTLYLFVFDIKKLLNEDPVVSTQAKTYLQNILETKKLIAPLSSVVLVGTNAADLSEADRNDVNAIIQTEILAGRDFRVRVASAGVQYHAVCCDKGDGFDLLKRRIHAILSGRNFIRENIPNTIHHAEKLLKETNRPYLKYSEIRKMFTKIGVRDDDVCELLLQAMAERGLITYLHQNDALKKIIVLNPQWLIRACRVAIYFNDRHEVLDHDIDNDQMVADFNTFIYQRVLSTRFLFHVLERMGYPKEVQKYVLNLMKATCMVAEYLFDDIDSYLTPTFFESPSDRATINEQDYSGPCFYLDFSGRHLNIQQAGNVINSKFMPFSFFEKLVSLSIQLSASFGQGIQPITKFKRARLSFGAEVDFMLSVVEGGEENKRPLKIKISTYKGTSQDKANDLAERIYSMALGIRKDFYPGVTDSSVLVLDLVVPSLDNEPRKLASYDEIQKQRALEQNVFPDNQTPGSVPTAEYDHWLRDGKPLQYGGKIKFIPKQADGNYELAAGKAQHCFLSYKETSALDIVRKQLEDLRRLGFTCWLNKEYKGNLTLDVYRNELKKSMCFILVLSVDVFESQIIIEELKTAIANDIPIIFLHHPDTDSLGYWTFDQYVRTCPADLRHLFDEILSIKLETRFYLQEAVTNKLVRRVREVVGLK